MRLKSHTVRMLKHEPTYLPLDWFDDGCLQKKDLEAQANMKLPFTDGVCIYCIDITRFELHIYYIVDTLELSMRDVSEFLNTTGVFARVDNYILKFVS